MTAVRYVYVLFVTAAKSSLLAGDASRYRHSGVKARASRRAVTSTAYIHLAALAVGCRPRTVFESIADQRRLRRDWSTSSSQHYDFPLTHARRRRARRTSDAQPRAARDLRARGASSLCH